MGVCRSGVEPGSPVTGQGVTAWYCQRDKHLRVMDHKKWYETIEEVQKPRRPPRPLQHQASTPGPEHGGPNASKGLHRRPAEEGECGNETDHQSRPVR